MNNVVAISFYNIIRGILMVTLKYSRSAELFRGFLAAEASIIQLHNGFGLKDDWKRQAMRVRYMAFSAISHLRTVRLPDEA